MPSPSSPLTLSSPKRLGGQRAKHRTRRHHIRRLNLPESGIRRPVRLASRIPRLEAQPVRGPRTSTGRRTRQKEIRTMARRTRFRTTRPLLCA